MSQVADLDIFIESRTRIRIEPVEEVLTILVEVVAVIHLDRQRSSFLEVKRK